MKSPARTHQIYAFSLALWSALVCLNASAQIQSNSVPGAQAPLTAQERLDAIRQSLVEASLKASTRVSSTTWLDRQGSLRENSTFKNNLEVAGVKVIGFERDDTGTAKARLQIPNGSYQNTTTDPSKQNTVKDIGLKGAVQKFNRLLTKAADFAKEMSPQDNSIQTPLCQPQAGMRLNHVMGLSLDIDPSANNVLLQTLLPQLQKQWVDQPTATGSARTWKAVNNLPDASMSKSMTSYERALIGNRPQTLPWEAVLKIRTEALPASGIEGLMGYSGNNLVLNLDFQILGTESQSEKFEESVSLAIDVDRPAWSAPKVNTASLTSIQDQLQTWRDTAEQWLSCQIITPSVTAVFPQQLQINAGTFTGVRKGDEWLVASPAQFPSGLLGKEGAPQTLLAKVQSVTPYNAQLVVLAGPAQAVQPEWRAWPTETLLTEPNLQPTTKRTIPAAKRSVKMVPTNAPATLTMSPY
jgi:hypothetical protein